MTQIYYILRSRRDGNYLIAHPQPQKGYLLMFTEYADALSYLNTHSPAERDQFSVESLPHTQVSSLLKRWQLQGIALVNDPLIPRVEFFSPGS
uniref:Uncharacterized protein n=1 Tax=Cyanothece sp. (strain PCC 7425 / ATCC 29141) TaxID=395961 RepID=B8HQY5_CYAP4